MFKRYGWADARYVIHNSDGTTSEFTCNGRERWALEALISAGERGCTPIDNPAPRWSAYVFDLRGFGVPIETITEPHAGPFAGTHARYVLKARVELRALRRAEAA